MDNEENEEYISTFKYKNKKEQKKDIGFFKTPMTHQPLTQYYIIVIAYIIVIS